MSLPLLADSGFLLKSGKRIEGQIAHVGTEGIVFRTGDGKLTPRYSFDQLDPAVLQMPQVAKLLDQAKAKAKSRADAEAEKKAKAKEAEKAYLEQLTRANAPVDVTYAEILVEPIRYLRAHVRMQGEFWSLFAEGEMFSLRQGDLQLDILYKELPKEMKAVILSQKSLSRKKVKVTGFFDRYSNSKNYFILARSVEID